MNEIMHDVLVRVAAVVDKIPARLEYHNDTVTLIIPPKMRYIAMGNQGYQGWQGDDGGWLVSDFSNVPHPHSASTDRKIDLFIREGNLYIMAGNKPSISGYQGYVADVIDRDVMELANPECFAEGRIEEVLMRMVIRRAT